MGNLCGCLRSENNDGPSYERTNYQQEIARNQRILEEERQKKELKPQTQQTDQQEISRNRRILEKERREKEIINRQRQQTDRQEVYRNLRNLEEERREEQLKQQIQQRIQEEHARNQSLHSIQECEHAQVVKQRPLRVIISEHIIKDFQKNCDHEMKLSLANSVYQLISLVEGSQEYYDVRRSFTSTNKKFFRVKEIKKVINPYLFMQYNLMKDRYKQLYNQVSEKRLFHGTRAANVDSICRHNFNWRLNGTARGHKFGRGVSFSPISYYATHYGDKTYDNVMFVVNVLVSRSCLGKHFMTLPPKNFDTTTNEKEHVFVKYEDNTFYPCYLIYYQGFDKS